MDRKLTSTLRLVNAPPRNSNAVHVIVLCYNSWFGRFANNNGPTLRGYIPIPHVTTLVPVNACLRLHAYQCVFTFRYMLLGYPKFRKLSKTTVTSPTFRVGCR